MPYVNDFIKIDIIGDCYGQAEIWNTGLKVSWFGLSSINEEVLENAASSIADAWEDFFLRTGSESKPYFNEYYRTSEVKASHVGTNGKVVGNTYSHFYDVPIEGPSGNMNPLPQASLVGSLRSSKQRGPGSQGRMYLPGLTYKIKDDGLCPVDDMRLLANDFNAFINDINNINGALGTQFEVILASPVEEGVELPVVQTGVDRKVDTQRRRANAIVSDYYTNEVI